MAGQPRTRAKRAAAARKAAREAAARPPAAPVPPSGVPGGAGRSARGGAAPGPLPRHHRRVGRAAEDEPGSAGRAAAGVRGACAHVGGGELDGAAEAEAGPVLTRPRTRRRKRPRTAEVGENPWIGVGKPRRPRQAATRGPGPAIKAWAACAVRRTKKDGHAVRQPGGATGTTHKGTGPCKWHGGSRAEREEERGAGRGQGAGGRPGPGGAGRVRDRDGRRP